MDITKISETEYRKVVPQEPIIIVGTIEGLISEKDNLLLGKQNNIDQIAIFDVRIKEIDEEITTVKKKGVIESSEIINTKEEK